MNDRNPRREPSRRRRMVGLGLALMVGAWLLVMPTPAWAATCGDDGTTDLFDSEGHYFDFTQGSTTGPDRDQPFATLYDSGSNSPAGTPPGPRTSSDAYDDWGALFVGGDAVANLYHSNDNNACTLEEGGREVAYPVVSIGGLQVQRKIFIAASGLRGARILNLVTNPGASPVTTSIQVGDRLSADNEGDLGSDGDTIVAASSSGDAFATPSDLWFVSTESGDSATGDPAIAHVMDGPGGLDRVDEIATTGDNIAWRWSNVTIKPGETVAYVSFEVLQAAAGGADATEIPLAAAEAATYQSVSADQVFAGMSQAEKDAVQNWHSKLPILSGKAKKNQRVGKLAVTATCQQNDCTVEASGSAATKIPVGAIATKAPQVNVEFDVKPATRDLAAGDSAKLRMRLAKKDLNALRALLQKGYRGKAVVTLEVETGDQTQTKKLRIRLLP